MLPILDNVESTSIECLKEKITIELPSFLSANERLLVIIPDLTRSAPIPDIFPVLCEIAAEKDCKIDFLIALGTHPALDSAQIDRLVGIPKEKRKKHFPNVHIFNHNWMDNTSLANLGEISADTVNRISGGLMKESIAVEINQLALAYDRIIICGPVFPHEVAGFSGGTKYLFPGIAGEEIINRSHWLGALVTIPATIGKQDTPVRQLIDRAAAMLPTPVVNISLCMHGYETVGAYIGQLEDTWSKAVACSQKTNIYTLDRQFKRVLSMPADLYDEMWTAAKAMYKIESIVEDGGELIIFAPNIQRFSKTHEVDIRQAGYHIRDYFLSHWEDFRGIPQGVLAHATHLRGTGKMENGIEHPRIQVTLATGIPENICRSVNLVYSNPARIDIKEWESALDGERFVVKNAGEVLYRFEP